MIGSLFAAADTAVTTLSSARLGALIEQAHGATKTALERIQREDLKLRSRYLLGRVVAAAISAVMFVVALRDVVPGPLGVAAALGATIVLTGIAFEITTTLARRHADRAAPACARWLRPLELALVPLAVPLGWLGALLQRTPAEDPDPRVTEAEVEIMVDEVERSGRVGREPAEMIRNVLEFADRTAREVMIPRGEIEALEIGTPIDDVVTQVTESGHSRYPVYKDQIDNVVGLLYAKDLFRAVDQRGRDGTKLAEIIRSPANFVAGSQSLSSLLREMRSLRQHLAIVVDELGAVAGIVTLEDVLEEIVGDIRDEHDEQPFTELGDGRLVADGAVSMSDLSEYLGAELPAADHASLGGMLVEHAGKVPKTGTAISKYGLRFIVRDADEQHIGKVEIIRNAEA
jgi:CBS domain containing-hemolysin-like protein